MSETIVSKKLYVGYVTEAETKVNHNLPARDGLTAEEVSNAVDAIIAQNVFTDAAGSPIAYADRAYVRTVSDQELF